MASLLILGATGHLGAHFTTAVREAYPDLPISVYLRSSAHDEELARLNISIFRGSFEDKEKLIDACSKHSIVVNAANSDNPSITETVIAGVKKSKGALLHVSGTGNFLDGGSSGNSNPNGKYWNDANKEDVKNINSAMLNGGADRIILDAGAAGDIKSFIVCSAGIHGHGVTKITSSSQGVIVSATTQNIIQLGYSPYIGEGTSVFCMVHVTDVVALMLLVLNKAFQTAGTDTFGQYYIAKGNEHSWKDLAAAFAKALERNGKFASVETKSVSADQAGFLSGIIGANMFITDDNAKALGFQPKGPTIFESLKELKL